MTAAPDRADPPVHRFAASPAERRNGFAVAGILAILGAAALIAGPLVPDGDLVAAVLLGLAAIQGVLVAHRTRESGPRMVVDDDGVWLRDWKLPVVPWRHVADVYQTGIRLQPYVCVELEDAAGFLEGLDAIARSRLRSNRLVRPPRLFVPVRALEATPAEVEAAVREGLERTAGAA